MVAFASYPSLDGAVVLVTGGASGIGEAIVGEFAKQNAKVAFLDIDDAAATRCINRLSSTGAYEPLYWHCDLRSVDDLRSAIEAVTGTLGPIRILLNNAANDTRTPLRDLTVAEWDDMMAVNLRHVAFASQAVAEGMASRGGGSIINFTSPTFRRKTPNLCAYGAAKAGIEGMTRIMAREYGSAKIRVNAIMPGWILTARQRSLWLTPEGEKALLEAQCLKHLVQAEDVARLALYLAADDSRSVTAQTYIVDAGLV